MKLKGLQADQEQHDLRAHGDIVCLRLPEKLRHYTLHLAKYCGRLSRPEQRLQNLNSTAVDVFIISLASCNALGIIAVEPKNQAVALPNGERPSVISARSSLAEKYFLDLVQITGRMAKVCESFDHLEEISYRNTLVAAVSELCQITLDLYTHLGADLELAVRQRWNEIESRS